MSSQELPIFSGNSWNDVRNSAEAFTHRNDTPCIDEHWLSYMPSKHLWSTYSYSCNGEG